MKKRLFVCTSNLCRSPVAEAVFNDLARERGLEWRAESAELSALEGERIPKDVEASLAEVGFYAGEHRARKAQRRMVEGADLVLAMTPSQREKLARLSGGAEENRTR